jgi:hypothetical protein
MDYLSRDSFYSGVAEGVIGYDRILKMLTVVENELVLEEKGIYSAEKFFVARHLMYWQVYLHKTSLAAEMMLIATLKRVKELLQMGIEVRGSSNLIDFLKNPTATNIEKFLMLDDTDIYMIFKENCQSSDFILKFLSKNLIERKIFNVILSVESIDQYYILSKKDEISKKYGLQKEFLSYLSFEGKVETKIYDDKNQKLNVLTKSGKLLNISELVRSLSSLEIFQKNYFIFAK